MVTSANRFSRASNGLLDSPSSFAWFNLCSAFSVYGHLFENLSNALYTLFIFFPSFLPLVLVSFFLLNNHSFTSGVHMYICCHLGDQFYNHVLRLILPN